LSQQNESELGEKGMFQATRRRLALWYTTVTAILLLLFASGVYLYVRSTLIERIDDTLNHVVEVVGRSLVIEPLPLGEADGRLRVNVAASFRDNAATGEDDHIDLEWFNPAGNLRWSTLAEPLDIPLHASNGETVYLTPSLPHALTLPPPRSGTEPLILRQVTQRVEVKHQLLGYLRVSHPWFEVTLPTRQLIVDLSLGTGLIVATVGAIGWFLSGLAMEPVRDAYQRLKQFTADASHELRSPIAIIQTNVQVALADPDPDPLVQQQHLKVVERLTRRLGKLVDDLLFLARQDSGIVQAQWGNLSLGELLEDVVEEQQAIAEAKGLDLSFQCLLVPGLEALPPLVPDGPTGSAASGLPADGDWTELVGDRDQLARLFTNVVGNAVQYTPTGGKIEVMLQRLGRPEAGLLQVTVRDTGIGIPAAALPQLFDRFYRVDPSRTQRSGAGSGLGLAIAQAIVDNHQGQVAIASILGQGTTVTVTLPGGSSLR
jgi:two-component system, OmpR family, manganese sensing sensor histidine kinase